MPNVSGNAYGLTTLCPLRPGGNGEESHINLVRRCLDALPLNEHSPMAAVPNTYLCRFFVLDNVIYQDLDLLKAVPLPFPAREDRLKSAYLVFSANFHGRELDPYLRGMWSTAREAVRQIWRHCIGFESVTDARSFCRYIKRCQVETTFYFNGSNDESLAAQLKGLYLKQKLSQFVFEHQGKSPREIQNAFMAFLQEVRPDDLNGPTWRAGASTLEKAVVGELLPLVNEPVRGPSVSDAVSERKAGQPGVAS